MIMVADSVPGLKRWVGTLGLKDSTKLLVIRVVVAFLLHAGRMSCLRAAGAVRCETRHRAQISRFLARPRWRKLDINSILRRQLLEREVADGLFVFIVDATLVSQAGKKTENTYSTGNRQRRPCKGRRYGKNKHARKNCHSFTMGLLITPSGIRIPFCKPYHTHEYCKKNGRTAPHHSRGGSRFDSRTAAAGRGASDRAGRYGVRRRGGPRRLRRPRLLVDISVQPRARLGWPEREAAQGAFAPEGLVEVVTADRQACSGSRPIRRVSASVAASDWAESETSDVLRPPGKTTGALGRRGPACLFDNERQPQNCHARRRENPDDERPAAFRARRGRVVLAALADRVILQGTQVDTGLPPVPVPEICSRWKAGWSWR